MFGLKGISGLGFRAIGDRGQLELRVAAVAGRVAWRWFCGAYTCVWMLLIKLGK